MNSMSSVGPPREFAIDSPVILFGHGRSGTSIIAALMREHLGVAFGTESQFILPYFDRLESFGSLQRDENLERMVDALLAERWFQRSRKFREFSLTRDQILAAVDSDKRSYRSVLQAIFSLFAKHLGMARWGDKTPAYLQRMDVIDQLFPDAQYVYVVRDGRDVALSLQQIHFGPKNMYTAAHDWRATVRKGDAFASSVAPDRVFAVRYEDFVADPVQTFVDLARFLQVQENVAVLRADLEANLAPKIKQDNADKWRTQLSRRQLLAYERIAFDELALHGYDTFDERMGDSTNRFAHCFWHTLSEMGRWRFKDYWKDNFYKARLRLRRFTELRQK